MTLAEDETLDEHGSLAGAAAGDDELGRPVDTVPHSVIEGEPPASETDDDPSI
jgi:hypothetical protein